MRMYGQTTLLAASGLGLGLTMGACGTGQEHRMPQTGWGCASAVPERGREILRKAPIRALRGRSVRPAARRESTRAA